MVDRSYKNVERSHSGFNNGMTPLFQHFSTTLFYAHVYMVYYYYILIRVHYILLISCLMLQRSFNSTAVSCHSLWIKLVLLSQALYFFHGYLLCIVTHIT